MKTLLLTLAIFFTLNYTLQAQCSTSTIPIIDCFDGDYISSFSFNGANSTISSGCASGGYASQASLLTTVCVGSTVSWTLNTGYYSEDVSIWIDLNNDNVYANTERVVYTTSSSTSFSSNFTMPTCSTGVNLRMRVRCSFFSSDRADPCSSGSNALGETEDYYIRVLVPPTLFITSQTNIACNGASTGAATIGTTGSGSFNYSWSPSGGFGATASSLSAGTYNCSVYELFGCSSSQSVTITEPSATSPPTATSPQSFITGSTISNIVATGTAIQWYDALTGGNLLTSTTVLVDGTIYYASQTTSGCESNRTPVVANIDMPFITTWNLATAGSGTTYIQFDAGTTGTVSYTWTGEPSGTSGSGTFTSGVVTIAGFTANDIITLSIAPTNFKSIKLGSQSDKNRLTNINQWGTTNWNSMNSAFSNCSNLNISATDVPNLAGVANMSFMFSGCINLNSPTNIGTWNTATVTNMNFMFSDATAFNQNIGNWYTTNVTSMSYMFNNATAFNQNIGNWNTANVTDMIFMFNNATAFNQNIGAWNTVTVTNMIFMFSDATVLTKTLVIGIQPMLLIWVLCSKAQQALTKILVLGHLIQVLI